MTITGDGCFLMSAMEISTAAREHLPVKFFVLDDQAYHYMQELQRPAYLRTTATILARLNYRDLASGFGVGYRELTDNADLEPQIRGILCDAGPVLVRVAVDYRRRPIRWLAAARAKLHERAGTLAPEGDPLPGPHRLAVDSCSARQRLTRRAGRCPGHITGPES